MSRSRKWRKSFGCGHRGFGQFCHCCADRDRMIQQKVALRKASQEKREVFFVDDGVTLRGFPGAVIRKARQILEKLMTGIHPGAIGGKRFEFDRDLIRIPIGLRYRLLCRRYDRGIQPLEVMSHEDYNAVAKNKRTV